jgi:myo-inositol-1(or 4)-monophosphatase
MQRRRGGRRNCHKAHDSPGQRLPLLPLRLAGLFRKSEARRGHTMTAVDFEGFVDRLTAAAGETILPFFRTSLGVENKARGGSYDPVTAADRGAERAMRTLIEQTFPEHGILGEEYGTVNPDAEFVWVLDPIDGTRAFITGMPGWGTLVGLLRQGSPCFGQMYQPFTRERFSGDGRAARYRGPSGDRKLRTRSCASLSEAALSTTSPRLFEGAELDAFEALESNARLTRFGGDCYSYCMLAAGHIDLVIESGLQPYDIVALIPIIEGAGGVVSDWQGGPAAGGGRIVAAGDARLHTAALERLSAVA